MFPSRGNSHKKGIRIQTSKPTSSTFNLQDAIQRGGMKDIHKPLKLFFCSLRSIYKQDLIFISKSLQRRECFILYKSNKSHLGCTHCDQGLRTGVCGHIEDVHTHIPPWGRDFKEEKERYLNTSRRGQLEDSAIALPTHSHMLNIIKNKKARLKQYCNLWCNQQQVRQICWSKHSPK